MSLGVIGDEKVGWQMTEVSVKHRGLSEASYGLGEARRSPGGPQRLRKLIWHWRPPTRLYGSPTTSPELVDSDRGVVEG